MIMGLVQEWYRGVELVYGSNEDDSLVGAVAATTVYGGSGNDTIRMRNNHDSLVFGGDGNDYIKYELYYGYGSDSASISGGTGDDVIDVSADMHGFLISGDEGNDLILGSNYFHQAGPDTIYGGAGNDSIVGYGGDDHLNGGDGDDDLWGENGHDSIWGGAGNDSICGHDGNDVLVGEAGNDTIWGGYGDDRLTGDAVNLDASLHGADFLYGDYGNDHIWGGAGNDSLGGGEGADWIYGGAGNDSLWGCDGTADGEMDVFVFYAGEGVQADVIMDFESGVDGVYVPDASFTKAEIHGNDLWAYVGDDRGVIVHNAVGKTLLYRDASDNQTHRCTV